MAKKATFTVTAPSRELTEFTEVLYPGLDLKTNRAIFKIVAQFLESLNERERKAAQKTEEWQESLPKMLTLHPVTKQVKIDNQEQADAAGAIANSIAATVKEIGESWEKETAFFNRFHKTLTARRGKYQAILNALIGKIKLGIGLWVLQERKRREEEEAKINAALPAEAPPVTLDKPRVEGMSPRTIYKYQIVNLMDLLRLIVKGKAPITAIQVNDSWMTDEVNQKHDMAIEAPDGRRYLYDGTVEVIEDVSMARRA